MGLPKGAGEAEKEEQRRGVEDAEVDVCDFEVPTQLSEDEYGKEEEVEILFR